MPYRMTPSVRHRAIEVHYYYYFRFIEIGHWGIQGEEIVVQWNCLGMGRVMSLFRILGCCRDMSERLRYFRFFVFFKPN